MLYIVHNETDIYYDHIYFNEIDQKCLKKNLKWQKYPTFYKIY